MSYIFEVLLTIMYNNEQTLIISVCISQSCMSIHSFTDPWLSFPWKTCFRDVGAGFVVPFTTFDAPSHVCWPFKKMGVWIEALTVPLGLWTFLRNGLIASSLSRHLWRCEWSWLCSHVIQRTLPVGSLSAQSSDAAATAWRPQSLPLIWRSTSMTSSTISTPCNA